MENWFKLARARFELARVRVIRESTVDASDCENKVGSADVRKEIVELIKRDKTSAMITYLLG